jgi:hypothetical protein
MDILCWEHDPCYLYLDAHDYKNECFYRVQIWIPNGNGCFYLICQSLFFIFLVPNDCFYKMIGHYTTAILEINIF